MSVAALKVSPSNLFRMKIGMTCRFEVSIKIFGIIHLKPCFSLGCEKHIVFLASGVATGLPRFKTSISKKK